MDLVDIDKVLDDFELNEDNSHNHNANYRNEHSIESIQSNKLLTAVSSEQNSQQCNSVPAKQFINVSNVFHSLNEYVNAGVDAQISMHQHVEEMPSEQEIGLFSELTSTSSISLNAESKAKFIYDQSLLSGSLMTTSSSGSSTTDLSPRSTTSSVSLIQNSPSLTNDDEVCKDHSNQSNARSNDIVDNISYVPNTKSEINDEQTGFSSVSSMCLNNQITSSHSSYSQDIIGEESSSLSPLNPQETHNDDHVVGEIVENDVDQKVFSSIPTKPIGFESTMDDVSDTELESYLQELELEHPTLTQVFTNCEGSDVKDSENICNEKCVAKEPSQMVDDGIGSGDDRNAQNADSFSQASTVEFADLRLHSDFELSPSVENVPVEKVIEEQDVHDDELSEAEVAYEKPFQRPNSLDLTVKVVVETECHADAADQTPTEQVR